MKANLRDPRAFQQARRFVVNQEEAEMVALIVLLLLLAVFGGLGFAVHALWFVLIAAVIIWAIAFFARGATGGRRFGL